MNEQRAQRGEPDKKRPRAGKPDLVKLAQQAAEEGSATGRSDVSRAHLAAAQASAQTPGTSPDAARVLDSDDDASAPDDEDDVTRGRRLD